MRLCERIIPIEDMKLCDAGCMDLLPAMFWGFLAMLETSICKDVDAWVK